MAFLLKVVFRLVNVVMNWGRVVEPSATTSIAMYTGMLPPVILITPTSPSLSVLSPLKLTDSTSGRMPPPSAGDCTTPVAGETDSQGVSDVATCALYDTRSAEPRLYTYVVAV